MTPLKLGGLDSALVNQLNNQAIQNPQADQSNTALQSENITNNQNIQNENKDGQQGITGNLEKQIQKAIEQLTTNLSYLNTHLNITVDKKADSVVIKIIDNKTNQVIKEIPPEYMLRIAEAINNLVGIIVNKKV
ncbi:flagellar protein FlaG [Hydrogenobaculum acidophilum]